MNQQQIAHGEDWVIEPRLDGMSARSREVWRYRRLLRFFAAQSLEKLYKRTVLGWSWILIRPLFPLLVKTMIFGGVLGIGSNGVPYFLFLVVGTAVWELFAQVAMWGTRSLELNRRMLTQIYVPRVIMPIAMGTPALVTFLIHLGVAVAALLYFRVTQGVFYWNPQGIGWALQGALLAWLLGLAVSLWTSVPALVARDVRFTLNYVLGFWVFLTPVFYPLSSIAPERQWLMALNPMTSAVETFKWGLLGIGGVDFMHLGIAWAVTLVVLVGGMVFFGRAERNAADRV